MHSLDRFAAEKLADLEAKHLRRRLHADRRLEGALIERAGRRLISFACNDYLGLSTDPRVRAAAAEAALAYGAGAGASRLVTGNHPLLPLLEQALARHKGTEAACVFGAGYLANVGVIPALAGAEDLVLVDALAHACLWSGAKLSGARVQGFAHNDLEALAAELHVERPRHRRCLVLVDHVYSMDGDLAPLERLAPLCAAHDAWLLVDDAHGLGVVAEPPGVSLPLRMGTLSKALGSYGGYLCASEPVVELLRNRARPAVYSTGLPPAAAGAALAALAILEAEPERAARPLRLAQRFTAALGLPEAQSPIVPIVLGGPERALAAQAALEAAGFLAVAIRPPTVPEGSARLRLAFSAAHREPDVDGLAEAVRSILNPSE